MGNRSPEQRYFTIKESMVLIRIRGLLPDGNVDRRLDKD
jgi:hypothetical protein